MSDPRIRKELDAIRSEEKDDMRRLALEAALYDDELMSAARDLKIEELKAKLRQTEH
jgi:hypothetical protein